MTQNVFATIDPTTKSGTQLATDLNNFRDSLLTSHAGSTRPSYAVAKSIWVNDATVPWVVNMYDGADDIVLGVVNPTTNIFTPSSIQNSLATWGGTGGGTVDAIAITLAPTPIAYVAGQKFSFISSGANTGAVTLNVNSLGAKNILDINGNALTAGTIAANSLVEITYDGTQFKLSTTAISRITTEPTGFRNKIINGSMRIDQRNAGGAVTAIDNGYTLDRWKTYSGAASKFNIQQSATSSLSGFPNTLIITSLSAYTAGATEAFALNQPIEGFNILDLGWGGAGAKSVTLSFKVTSSLTGTFSGSLGNGSGRSYPFTFSIPVANTWTNIAVTIPGDSSGTWLTTSGLGLIISFDIGSGANYKGTAGAWTAANLVGVTGSVSVIGTNAAVFNISGIQLETGSVATPFEHRQISTELALCQRYYETSYNDGVTAGSVSVGGRIHCTNLSAGAVDTPHTIQFKVKKRTTPFMYIYPAAGGANGYCTADNIGQFGGTIFKNIASLTTWDAHWVADAEL